MIHLRCTSGPLKDNEIKSEWMKVIHTANRVDKIFGEPTFLGPWWAGGSVEEYDDARVIHRPEDPKTVSIVAKTDRGHTALVAAAAELGMHWSHV